MLLFPKGELEFNRAMNIYRWRHTLNCFRDTVSCKLAFKTHDNEWLQTEDPVVILVSLQSAFHEGIFGDIKMDAFVSTIKKHVKGRITVLLDAHYSTMSLTFEDKLAETFKAYFEGCQVVSSLSYIRQDGRFGRQFPN